MLTADFLEAKCIQLPTSEFIYFIMELKLIRNEFHCNECLCPMKLVPYKKLKDSLSWRCMNILCARYKLYTSIRKDSYFENFNISLNTVFRILVKYSTRQPMHSIKEALDISNRTIERVLNKFRSLIPAPDYSNNKLGGPGKIIQVDETMLNYKCKSHRGRSPSNKTDSLCIVEFCGHITRCYAKIIPNKYATTLVPLICRQVAANSIIWTDEHRSYSKLNQFNFVHNSVCHKYEFINKESGVNTQAVESFHNELKLEIKKRKGVLTENREQFLNEFCFTFNNRKNLLNAILELIKIN